MSRKVNNTDSPILQNAQTAGCNCPQCQRKRQQYYDAEYDDYDDLGLGTMLTIRYGQCGMTTQLPVDPAQWETYRKTWIDCGAFNYLTEKQVINWCSSLNMLYPIKTAGDGNCLLHAVSQYMWSRPDDTVFLRNLVYKNMSVCSYKTKIRQRWQKQREWQNASIPDGGLHYTDDEWNNEWQLLVAAADLENNSPTKNAALPYAFLEQIHVFVLANILQRPIIILGEPYLRSLTGESIEPNDFIGIYLPLLHSPSLCHQSPVVLAFLMDHFLPLLSQPLNADQTSQLVSAVPLVSSTLEPLHIHFLLPDEERAAYNTLQRYLRLSETQVKADENTNAVLVALLYVSDLDQEPYDPDVFTLLSSTLNDTMFLQSPSQVKCTTESCEFRGWSLYNDLCLACYSGYVPQKSDSDYHQIWETLFLMYGVKISLYPQCMTVDCQNKSMYPLGGLCRPCVLGIIPSHYNMTYTDHMKYVKNMKKRSDRLVKGEKCWFESCPYECELVIDYRKLPGYVTDEEELSLNKTQLYYRDPEMKVDDVKRPKYLQSVCFNHTYDFNSQVYRQVISSIGRKRMPPKTSSLPLPRESKGGLCWTPNCRNIRSGKNKFCWRCLQGGKAKSRDKKCLSAGCQSKAVIDGLCLKCILSEFLQRPMDYPDETEWDCDTVKCKTSRCGNLVSHGEEHCSVCLRTGRQREHTSDSYDSLNAASTSNCKDTDTPLTDSAAVADPIVQTNSITEDVSVNPQQRNSDEDAVISPQSSSVVPSDNTHQNSLTHECAVLKNSELEIAHNNGQSPLKAENVDQYQSYQSCIGPVCKNFGEKLLNGLCQSCYNILKQTNTVTSTDHVVQPAGDKSPGDEASNKCMTDGCPNAITHIDIGLCDVCYLSNIKYWQSLQILQTANAIYQLPKVQSARCLTPTCRRYGKPALNGFCEKCSYSSKRTWQDPDKSSSDT